MTRNDLLLLQLMEEAAEVTQAISKQLRFGPEHTWPNHEGPASECLFQECMDFFALIDMCQDAGVIKQWDRATVAQAIRVKKERVEKYLEISKSLGCME